MLDPVSTLKSNLLALAPTTNPAEGIKNFVGVIADYMNNVQGGPLGSPGIFTFSNSLMILALTALSPVSDSSWVAPFVNGFQSACEAAIITPATVSNPVWIGSGGFDVLTLPIGAATIPTISLAASTLMSALNSAKADSSAPQAMAQGIHDATLQFIFTCIGLGSPPIFPPIPILTSAM